MENFELVLTHSQAELLLKKIYFFQSAFCCDSKKMPSLLDPLFAI